MNEHTDQFERELRDPALSALLREAFADDPALQSAPGRTERIMRKVMTSGVRPIRRGVNWGALGWATGAMATAAAAIAIAIGMLHPPQDGQIANGNPPVTPAPTPAVIHKDISNNQPIVAVTPDDVLPTVNEAPRPKWEPIPEKRTVTPQLKSRVPEHTMVATADSANTAEEPENESPVHVAAALYSAGSAAQAAGDYQTAYQSYQASYDTMPTPDALLASSRALQQMAQQDLATDIEG